MATLPAESVSFANSFSKWFDLLDYFCMNPDKIQPSDLQDLATLTTHLTRFMLANFPDVDSKPLTRVPVLLTRWAKGKRPEIESWRFAELEPARAVCKAVIAADYAKHNPPTPHGTMTQAEYSRQTGLTAGAVSKQVKRGLIPTLENAQRHNAGKSERGAFRANESIKQRIRENKSRHANG